MATITGSAAGANGLSASLMQAFATLTGGNSGRAGASTATLIGCDFHVQIWGQSNAVGFADFSATGGAGTDQTGADTTLYTSFPACNFRQLSSTAPASGGNPQTYNINTGVIALQPYAAAGGNNIGAEQSLGRNLVKYGLCANPYIGKDAVASSSIPGHWAKASGFPGVGTSVYQQLVNSWNASVAETGRNIDVIVHQIGETDANTPSRVTNAVADITSMYTNLRVDVPGCANAIVVIVMVNPFASLPGDGDVAGYRAQQVIFVNTDPTNLSVLVDPFDIPLRSDPHYGAAGYWSLGDRILLAIKKKLFPTRSLNFGVGPSAFYQADDPVSTAQVSPAVADPRGAFDERENDLQILIAASYTQATTHALVSGHDAGFVQIGTLVESVSTNHHALTLWSRVVKNSAMSADAAGVLRMPIPQVQFSASTLNLAQIVTIRNADPVTPINTSLTGANNAFNTTLSVPSSATPTTVNANTLAFIVACTTGATNLVTNIVNSSLSNITIQRNGRANPGAGTVGLAFATGTVNGTSLGQTVVTTTTTALNVGAVLAINPATITLSGGAPGRPGNSASIVQVLDLLNGSAQGAPGSSTGLMLSIAGLSGSAFGSAGFSIATLTAPVPRFVSGSAFGSPGTSASLLIVVDADRQLGGQALGGRGSSFGLMFAAPAVSTITGVSFGAAGFSGGVVLVTDMPPTSNPISWDDVLGEAPELTNTKPLAREGILDFVNTKLVVSGIDGELGRKTYLARVYLAAHMATLAARRGMAGTRTSQSSGPVAEAYSPLALQRLGAYATTGYGILYASIIDTTAHRAGQLINRRVQGPGFDRGSGRFGGGFGGGGFAF